MLEQLQTDLEAAMRQAQVPGMAWAIVREGEIIHAVGLGVTSVEDGALPVTPDTLFRFGSITKPMTGTLILRAGLELDKPVVELVPALHFAAYGEQITLRHLLSHTSGLPSSYHPFSPWHSLADYIQHALPNYQFIAPPGRVYSYSNVGIRVAGYIAEALLHTPYTDLMQQYLFDPLSMARTTFDPTVAMTYPLAQSHDVLADGQLQVQHRYANNVGGYPSGGVISTVRDMAQFILLHLQDESLQFMQHPQIKTFPGTYGLTWALQDARVYHEGFISTFGSKMVLHPPSQTGIVLVSNRGNRFWEALDHAVDVVLGASVHMSVADRPYMPPEGYFVGHERGIAEIRGANLVWNGERLPLNAVEEDLFSAQRNGTDIWVGIVDDDYILLNASPCARRQPFPPFLLEDAQKYVGTYDGADTLTIRETEAGLRVFSVEYARESVLLPLAPDFFACDFGTLAFTDPILLSGVYRLFRRR